MNHTSSAAVHRASRRASQRRASMNQANDDTPSHTSQSSSIQSTTSETNRNSIIDELYPEVQNNNNTNQTYTTNNWKRVIDPSTRQSYYWNTVTGLTSWNQPNELQRSSLNEENEQEEDLQEEEHDEQQAQQQLQQQPTEEMQTLTISPRTSVFDTMNLPSAISNSSAALSLHRTHASAPELVSTLSSSSSSNNNSNNNNNTNKTKKTKSILRTAAARKSPIQTSKSSFGSLRRNAHQFVSVNQVSSTSNSTIIKEGWLSKLTQHFFKSKMKKRYFVLKSNALYYYKMYTNTNDETQEEEKNTGNHKNKGKHNSNPRNDQKCFALTSLTTIEFFNDKTIKLIQKENVLWIEKEEVDLVEFANAFNSTKSTSSSSSIHQWYSAIQTVITTLKEQSRPSSLPRGRSSSFSNRPPLPHGSRTSLRTTHSTGTITLEKLLVDALLEYHPPKGRKTATSISSFSDNGTIEMYQTKRGPILMAPTSLSYLRRASNLDDETYRDSLKMGFTGVAKPGDGKSGQLFLMTKNKKLVIKTLKGYEAIFLKKILSIYLHHLDIYPGSLLCRFFDVITLNEPSTNAKISLLVMPNVLQCEAPLMIHEVYDLKGSVRNRRVSEEEIELKGGKVTLKDINWNERCSIENGNGMLLNDKDKTTFQKQLALDSTLLRELDIMDYSLLLGVAKTNRNTTENDTSTLSPDLDTRGLPISSSYWSSTNGGLLSSNGDEIYYISVIDILQEFDFTKRMENKFKSLRRKEKLISAVNASLYAKRFYEYITKQVLGQQIIFDIDGNLYLSSLVIDRLSQCLCLTCMPKNQWNVASMYHGLLLSDDYKTTISRRVEQEYSCIEVAPEVYRTIRHAFGFHDSMYYQILQSSFLQYTSRQGAQEESASGSSPSKETKEEQTSRTSPSSSTSSLSSASSLRHIVPASPSLKPKSKPGHHKTASSSSSSMDTHDLGHFFCESIYGNKTITIMGISDNECDTMLSSLENYCKYVCEHPNTLLPRILGIYKHVHVRDIDSSFGIHETSIVIFEQMFLNDAVQQNFGDGVTLLKTVSLKGSKSSKRTMHRHSKNVSKTQYRPLSSPSSVSSVDSKTILTDEKNKQKNKHKNLLLKRTSPIDVDSWPDSSTIPHLLDLDFDQSIEKPLQMKMNDKTKFLQSLSSDLDFLKKISSMNYSLSIHIYHCKTVEDTRTMMQHRPGRCFQHVNNTTMYVIGLSKINDRWEGSKKVGGNLMFLRGGNLNKRTNINPKLYKERLFNYMMDSVK
jgi:hypothetical protein